VKIYTIASIARS